eukprot:CAMPEP_0204637518 /NCGR_PEP_ID=MMETSP0717-20131115/36834_1 /ASSEMBLY_ACC=CAM_ASM_000666 /TAXON_ID=230516 /ORGANISM="Chaetoceros curvisetus" /LENGTH=445 /DNA_ID=CAMNT_0051656963 /DNA_START=57 /DNA_END=1394 /DNA_ORIENTATION=+
MPKTPFIKVLHKDSTNDDLRKIYNYKNKKYLVVYEVEVLAVAARPPADKVTKVRFIRKIEETDTIPFTYDFAPKTLTPRLDINEVSEKIAEIINLTSANFGHDDNFVCPKTWTGWKFPWYFPLASANEMLLKHSHTAISFLLPEEDTESYAAMKVAKEYYDYWRPNKVKIIILAESHVFTDELDATQGHVISTDVLSLEEYPGPRDYCALVYCIGYGEKSVLVPRENKDTLSANTTVHMQCPSTAAKGTVQFWKVLSALAGEAPGDDGTFGTSVKKTTMKCDNIRIRNKFNILMKLRKEGIWLLDTSMIGWYIQQPRTFNINRKNKMVYPNEKARPQSEMKRSTLLLSWELYTKHIVRQAANEGHLQMLIPVGNQVNEFVTRVRMEEAVTSTDGVHKAVVSDPTPAPNAWQKEEGDGDRRLLELQQVVHNVLYHGSSRGLSSKKE